MQKVKGRATDRKDTAYSLVEVTSSGGVLLCPAEEEGDFWAVSRKEDKASAPPSKMTPGRQSGTAQKVQQSYTYALFSLLHFPLLYLPYPQQELALRSALHATHQGLALEMRNGVWVR